MKNLDLLIPQAAPVSDVWRWATVTASSPLTIRLDGDTDPLDLVPDNLVGMLAVGKRVWVQISGKRVLIVGVAGGGGAPEPVGRISQYAGDTAPAGFLLCDGGTFSSTVYPELAALVGDKFGLHVGTSYYLPDLRKRVAVGKDTSTTPDTDFSAIGKTGGEKNHTLSEAEMPSHVHSAWTDAQGNHAHGFTFVAWQTTTSGSSGVWRVADIQGAVGATGSARGTNTNYAGSHGHNVGIGATGGNAAHNNMQPFLVLNFIIVAR